MPRQLKIILQVLLGIFLLVALLTFFRRHQNSAKDTIEGEASASNFLNLAANVDYVGDEECATCHSTIYRTFKTTGMGRSFYQPTPENIIEDYTRNNQLYDPRARLHYQMYRRDNEFYQLEYRLGEKGEIIHGYGRQVDYIIGSGNHNRTYVTSENGFLFEMPVTWYSEKQLWDLSPGYHRRNLRFSRPIVPECMNCHNSYAEYVEHSENRYRMPLPLGIGCERCHGPGALHIAKRFRTKFDPSKKEQIDSTIVNPKHLPAELQMDVCRQCHLQGDMSVLKEGRKETDFRPGMRLREVKSIFIRDRVETGDFRIASHGARLSLSACYVKSGGQLVCTSCHNPHIPVRTVPRTFFNTKCLDCHALTTLAPTTKRADHRQGSDCVVCHMRQGATSDILHVNFTDHWIRKDIKVLSKAETDSLLGSDEAAPIVLRDFFREDDAQANLRLGIAYVRYFEAKHSAAEYLTRAVSLLETGLHDHPTHQSAHYYLGVAYTHQHRLAEAQAQFEKVIALAPDYALAYFQLGVILQAQSKFEEAITAYRKSLNVFADNATVYNNLGNVYAALGKVPEAIAAYERAVHIQPSYALAYNNLGDLYFYQLHDVEAGKQCFEKALRLDPNFVTALHNLGNVYLSRKEEDNALQLFQRILELDLSFAQAHGNVAIIYQHRGQREKAISHLRKILEIDPHDLRAQDMLRQLGVQP